MGSSTRSHEASSADAYHHHHAAAPTTLFSNVMDADEAQQLRTYARIIEQQNRRVAELERQHEFLESELETRTSDLARLESTMEWRESEWKAENDALRTELEKSEENVKTEVSKNEKMLESINKKDIEIRRLIQRKYDTRDQRHGHGHEHGHHHQSHGGHKSSRHHDRLKRSGSNADKEDDIKHGGRSRDITPPPAESSIYAAHVTETERRFTHSPTDNNGAQFMSPQYILEKSGTVEAVRERNVTNSLLDFFGM
mmetsp:Transcript_6338/g.12192  ORF Transcript_6338/g.12192 Transcript_6338/m.12192 type:complete len:255 (+) Transcript_6338:1016-1780(+)